MISISSHSVKLAGADSPPPVDSTTTKKKEGGGFFSSLLKLIFFGAICGAGYVAFKAYQAKKGKPWDAKRF